jgi:hypothetical protein
MKRLFLLAEIGKDMNAMGLINGIHNELLSIIVVFNVELLHFKL